MRFLLFIVFLSLIFRAGLAWQRWENGPPAPTQTVHADANDLVALPNGATMMAGSGTVTRALVDWLEDLTPGTKTFELGGEEFIGRTSHPTPESLGRLSRLVAMLKAYPQVDVVVIGHSSTTSDPEQDRTLALARANRLVDLLEEARINPARLRIEGRGSADPLTGTEPASEKNDRVSLVLARKP